MTIAVLANLNVGDSDEDAGFLISGGTGLREFQGLLSRWDGLESSVASCHPMEWQEEESGTLLRWPGVPRS
jgi:hypothetical protein